MLAILIAPAWASAFQATGFQQPYGVTVDAVGGYIYVSNMNGGYDLKDANGFISRLNKDGTVDTLRYFGGEASGKTLHAPKGMAVVESRLYVADIDLLRVYELKTGKFLYNINFGTLPIKHLFNIAVGPEGALYVTDAPGNAVYRIDVAKQHEVSLFASGDFLAQPRGICWFPPRQIFVVASWSTGQLVEFDKAGKRQILPAVTVGEPESCAADSGGNFYITSKTLDAVFQVTNDFALYAFALSQQEPSGLAFDAAGKQLIVVTSDSNSIQSFDVEATSAK